MVTYAANPSPWRLRQRDPEFKVILRHIASTKPVWTTRNDLLKSLGIKMTNLNATRLKSSM